MVNQSKYKYGTTMKYPKFSKNTSYQSANAMCLKASLLLDKRDRNKFMELCKERHKKLLKKLKSKRENKDEPNRLINLYTNRSGLSKNVPYKRREEILKKIKVRKEKVKKEITDRTMNNTDDKSKTRNKKQQKKAKQIEKEKELLKKIEDEIKEERLGAKELRNYQRLIAVLNDERDFNMEQRKFLLENFKEFFDELNVNESNLEDIIRLQQDLIDFEKDEMDEADYQQQLADLKEEEKLTEANINRLQDRLMSNLGMEQLTENEIDESIKSNLGERDSDVSSLDGSNLRLEFPPREVAKTARGA